MITGRIEDTTIKKEKGVCLTETIQIHDGIDRMEKYLNKKAHNQ